MRRLKNGFSLFTALLLLTGLQVAVSSPTSALTLGSGSGLFALLRNETITYTTPPPDVRPADRCGSTILQTINFNWNSSSIPTGTSCGTISGSSVNNITAMITGYILAPETANVTFKVQTDDGFYMNINGTNVISSWQDQGALTGSSYNATGSFSMTEGRIYPIKIFWHNTSAGAEARLFWNYGSGDQIVPQSNLGLTASDLGTGCAVGESEFCPADNARQIKNLNGTNTNGKYWINVGGVSRQVYVLMDRDQGLPIYKDLVYPRLTWQVRQLIRFHIDIF